VLGKNQCLARARTGKLEQIFQISGVTVVVYGEDENNQGRKHDDVTWLIKLFVASHYGERPAGSNSTRREEIETGGERTGDKSQKQEERNASIPLEWNQEDYDRLEELTLELLELHEQHKCVREVVENHYKDIKKVKRSIAALTNKYTLVECNPEDSDTKSKRVVQRNSKVPPQWYLHDRAELEQLKVTLGILITDKEMVGEGHIARAYTIIRRENDIKFLVKKYTPAVIDTEEEVDDKETEVKKILRTKRTKVVLKKGCEANLEKLCQWIGTVRWCYK